MKNKKRILALCLAVMMLASCVTGCKGKATNKKETANSKTDIEISYWNAGLGTAWLDALIADFEELHPEYHVYYTATAAAAATTSAYSLEDVDTVDLYMTLAKRDPKYLEPLDDVLDTKVEGESKTIREKFNDGYLALLELEDGSIYDLTYGGGVLSFVYNKKLFKENGITQVPRTTDELTVVCDSLRKKGVTPLCHFIEGGYYEFVTEAFYMQYEGEDYYYNNFYGCTDENGNSPSKDVFTKKDGRYEVLKAYEKYITPDNVLQGSNSGTHVNMQTMFVNGECAMMVSGSWMVNEMKGNGRLEDFDMMRLPIISSITDKLDSIKKESDLRKLVSAIDTVLDGEKTVADYQKGDAYEVDGILVSAHDWDYVYSARTTVATNYAGESCFISKYSNAKEGAKEFLKYFYSDRGYKTYMENHLVMPLTLSEGTIDTSDWSDFELHQYQYLLEATANASKYSARKHPIFTDGGASIYASVQYINRFCSRNEADRLDADAVWDKVMNNVNSKYESSWIANIK